MFKFSKKWLRKNTPYWWKVFSSDDDDVDEYKGDYEGEYEDEYPKIREDMDEHEMLNKAIMTVIRGKFIHDYSNVGEGLSYVDKKILKICWNSEKFHEIIAINYEITSYHVRSFAKNYVLRRLSGLRCNGNTIQLFKSPTDYIVNIILRNYEYMRVCHNNSNFVVAHLCKIFSSDEYDVKFNMFVLYSIAPRMTELNLLVRNKVYENIFGKPDLNELLKSFWDMSKGFFHITNKQWLKK